jgi:hypothetical protein
VETNDAQYARDRLHALLEHLFRLGPWLEFLWLDPLNRLPLFPLIELKLITFFPLCNVRSPLNCTRDVGKPWYHEGNFCGD